MKRLVLVLSLLATAGTMVVAQRFSIDTTYFKSDGSVGGAVLYAPSYTTDQFFYFPPTGGMLLTTANFGGWLVGGQDLSSLGLLGSTNNHDVSIIAGGLTNVRMTFMYSAPAVTLPTRTALRLEELSGGNYSAIMAPRVQSGNITYVLPYNMPTEPGQRLQVDTVNGDTVVLGYTTEEVSTDVSFDTKNAATEADENTIDVADMAIAVMIPNHTYAFEAVISLQHNIGANANAQISFTLPAGASMHYYHLELTNNNPQATGNQTEAVEVFDAVQAPDEAHYILKGFVRVGANTGTVQMRLASTSNANIVRLTENSYMQITTN